LFASARGEPRARRPTDLALALVSATGLLLTAAFTRIGDDLDTALGDFLTALPPFLGPLWQVLGWSAVVWAGALLLVVVGRRRLALARDMVAGTVVAAIVAALSNAVLGEDAAAVITRFGDLDGPPSYPPGALALSTAALAVASPHLSRPFRHFGRWLVTGQAFAITVLGASTPGGTLNAVWTGLLAAAVVHLVVGSPGGRPTASRIELALRDLGVDAVDLEPASMQPGGLVRFEGRDATGSIDVRVYGRDACDAQLLATLWRLTWYRGSRRTPRLSRTELVEHEGLVTLLAERAGVVVPHVVTAGRAGHGDAIVAVRPPGPALADERPTSLSVEAVDGLWQNLSRLHDAGIAHRAIDLDTVVVGHDGALAFGALGSATVAATAADRHRDQAQALVLTVVAAGEDRAVDRAREALGDERLLDVLPYVQLAALPSGLRDALRDGAIDVDDLRNRIRAVLGADEQQLIRLRRVTAGSLLNAFLLGVAAYVLISALGGLDFEAFADALAGASWWWLAFAVLLAQLPRIPAAVGTTGSLAATVPLGPLVALQYAICFVNLSIPSTAARVAINIRFFQRFGVAPAAAVAAGVIDSVAGFIVQIAIFVSLFVMSDLDLHLSTDGSTTSGAATVVLIVLAVLAVAATVVAVVPAVRRRVVTALRQAGEALRVLRSPDKLLRLFGGNLLSQVLFAVAFAACAEAFGVHLPLSQLLLINTVVSLFAGLLPVPGGIGVSEAGLTFGLTTAGVPAETAFAIALAYRLASFYLPPLWGWPCYRWLVRNRLL
jgi:uncharacterized membrane protein YbhN (UPF0104 family)